MTSPGSISASCLPASPLKVILLPCLWPFSTWTSNTFFSGCRPCTQAPIMSTLPCHLIIHSANLDFQTCEPEIITKHTLACSESSHWTAQPSILAAEKLPFPHKVCRHRFVVLHSQSDCIYCKAVGFVASFQAPKVSSSLALLYLCKPASHQKFESLEWIDRHLSQVHPGSV